MSVVRSAVCVSFGKKLYAIWTAATVNIGCMSWKHPARVPQEMGCIRKDCNPVLLNNLRTLCTPVRVRLPLEHMWCRVFHGNPDV